MTSIMEAATAPRMRERPYWYLTKDGDRTVWALYERHYSARKYNDGRQRKLFCGPGEKIVLRTKTGDAGFVWRRFIDRSGQEGVNCSFFRNEGGTLSSQLIRQADAVADFIWPGRRHYTYVSAAHVRSRNPGFCFRCAGWRRTGLTKSGLIIFERPGLTRLGPVDGGVDDGVAL